jgi:hypothetical protein
MFEEMIDRLIVFFTGDRFRDDVAKAKKDFFDEAGVMDEESEVFEMRMTQFLEWYLFSRPLADVGLTPAQYALQLEDFQMTSEERPAFENLAVIRHSLFEFLKIRGDDIHIRDLFLDKKIVIHHSPIRIGFNRDEIFDGRLIPEGEEYHFSRAFAFHPGDASKYILSEIKKLKKGGADTIQDREALMLRLLKMRYKYEQYRHLKLDYVYTNEKKVKF